MLPDTGTGGSAGLVPAPPPGSAGSGSFLRADGVWGSVGAPNLSAYALLNSPAFAGTATVATQARGNFGSAIASTAFVINQQAQASELSLIMVNGTASAGTSTYAAKADHIHGTDTSRMAASSGNAFTATLAGTTTIGGTLNVAALSGTLTLPGIAQFTSLKLTGGSLTLSGALGIGSMSGAPLTAGNLTLANDGVNDVTISRHGFCPTLPNNAGLFLNGAGSYSVPTGVGFTSAIFGLANYGSGQVGMDTNNAQGIGSYMMLRNIGSNVGAGSTTDSGSLQTGIQGVDGGWSTAGAPPGSVWRAIAAINNDQVGLFIRVS
jgi:hypothetical protein